VSLDALFAPRSVAVVGASPTSGNLAGRALGYIRRFAFEGVVYAVNPNYTEVHGVSCFPALTSIPGDVDLALIMVPAHQVPESLDDCVDRGIGAAIVFSSGFAEIGESGRAAQAALADARGRGVRVLGPNCQGLINQASSLAATFTASVDPGLLPPSGIAYVGQSGAVGGSMLDLAREAGIGLSAWVSTGNQADLDVTEVADYLLDQPGISVLMLYLEQLPEGESWMRMLDRAAQAGKRIIALAAGRSEVGQRAAASHTGAMVSPGQAFRLASAERGVIEVADIDELLLTASAALQLPDAIGRQVAVVTTSGGAGSLSADHLSTRGFELPGLTARTTEALAEVVPPYGSTDNPIDVTAQLFRNGPAAFGDVIRLVRRDDHVDVTLVVLTMIGGDAAVDLARVVADAADGPGGPIAVVWLAGQEQTGRARALLRQAGIMVFDSVGQAASTLARLQDNNDEGLADLNGTVEPCRTVEPLSRFVSGNGLTEAEAVRLLDHLGLRSPKGMLFPDPKSAARGAAAIGDDLVLKIQSSQILHKSDVGGVRVGVPTSQVAEVAAEMFKSVRAHHPTAILDGLLVQRRAPDGVEILVGVQGASNGYPPVITVGLGGVNTEVHADVTSALAPVSLERARQMLRRLRSWPLLVGHRGAPHSDVDAAADVIHRVSIAASVWGGSLQELEMNPVVIHEEGDGATVVDILLTINASTHQGADR
jgi:acetate---CoA ligase (ADP-forming)